MVQTSPGLICVTQRLLAVADTQGDDRARLARVQPGVGGGRPPRRGVGVGAEEDRARLGVERWGRPDRARRRSVVKGVVAGAVLDRNRRLQGLGLGPDVVLPHDMAGLRLQGGDESPPRAALVAGEGRDDLLERAARDDQLAVGEDRRGPGEVQRVGPGELLASHAQLPTLLPGRPVQRVDPALQIREEDGVFVDQRRAVDAPIRTQLEAHGLDHLVLPPRLGLSRPPPELRIAVGPADLAVGRQLVERRGGRGRAEVDVAAHDDGRGVDGPDLLARALGGEPPLLFEPARIVPADGLLALVVAATEDVVVVRRPILRVGLREPRPVGGWPQGRGPTSYGAGDLSWWAPRLWDNKQTKNNGLM